MLIKGGQVFDLEKGFVERDVCTEGKLIAQTSGDEAGVASYGEVCDLLVNWHYQTVVLPGLTVEEKLFDPYDEKQVDLSGIVNAKEQETEEPENPGGIG